MKIGLKSNTVNKDNKSKNDIEGIKYQYYSRTLNIKFLIDYESEFVLFEDGVKYNLSEIYLLLTNRQHLNIDIVHSLKEIFNVTYIGKIKIEADDDNN